MSAVPQKPHRPAVSLRDVTERDRPRTRYATSGDVSIAFQSIGDGPIDLVLTPGFVSHLDLDWDNPAQRHLFRRIATFSRCVRFDKRGTGLSDRSIESASIEDRMDDVRAVMDAAGMERAALVGMSEGGPLSILFAATYPSRVSALVLLGTFAEPLDIPDLNESLARLEKYWGSGLPLRNFDSTLDVPDAARYERSAATPRMAALILRRNVCMDVRAALPAITCPTLVVHYTDDPVVPVAYARQLAAGIPHSRYLERAGAEHSPSTIEDRDALGDDIEEFLTGTKRSSEPDRMLATVMFTDIVASTERASSAGDRAWRETLEHHHGDTTRLLRQFNGRMVKSTGDGVLALFDGPSRAVRCAQAIVERASATGLSIRAGLHAGEVELVGDDVAGIAVHVAQRVESQAAPHEVLVSQTVRDLLAGSDIPLRDRGEHTLKGLDEPWRLYAVSPA